MPCQAKRCKLQKSVTGWAIRAYVYSKHLEMQTKLKRVSALYIICQNEGDFKLYVQESRPYGHLFQRCMYSIYSRISPLCEIQAWQTRQRQRTSCLAPMQENSNSVMTENDLLDLKANWRKFCEHSYFRDLTSNQRRLRK